MQVFLPVFLTNLFLLPGRVGYGGVCIQFPWPCMLWKLLPCLVALKDACQRLFLLGGDVRMRYTGASRRKRSEKKNTAPMSRTTEQFKRIQKDFCRNAIVL